MAARPREGTDPLATEVLNRTKPGRDAHRSRIPTYDKNYETYRASAKPNPTWQSQVRVKYGMQVIHTATVNMAQGKPRCKVVPRHPDHEERAKAFQQVFDYHTQRDHLAEKQPGLIEQALILGVTGGKNHWLYKEAERTSRTWVPHPYDPAQTVQGPPETRTVILKDGPSFEPWDIYDMWWDPDARDVDSAAYVSLRAYLSKDQLEGNKCTVAGEHDAAMCDGIYHNVDALLATGTGKPRTASAQERATGGDTNLRKDKFVIVENWFADNRLVVVGNDQIVLRDERNPHWHGQKPVVIASCRPDLFKIQGISEAELIADLQEAIWTIQNARLDSWHLTVFPMLTYREGGIVDPNAIRIMPRALIPVTDHDDLKQLEVKPLPPEAYEEESSAKSDLRDVTGITPYISGAATGSVDQNTATGVSILNNAASALLRFKANQVQYGIWQRTFEQWGDDIQQFMTEPLYVRIAGPGSEVTWEQVTPQDVVGDYDYVLSGTEEALSKAQAKQDGMALLNAFAPFVQMGVVNAKPLIEQVADAFGFANPDELLVGTQQGQPPAAPYHGGTPMGPQGNGQTLVNGGQMPGLVQQAIGQQ